MNSVHGGIVNAYTVDNAVKRGITHRGTFPLVSIVISKESDESVIIATNCQSSRNISN